MKRKTRESIYTLNMLAPWIVTFSVFWLYPLIYAGYLSLTKYGSLSGEATFIGFKNYINLMSDSAFWNALKVTSIFTIGTVPITTAVALALAALLDSSTTKFKDFFRASYFTPSVTSIVVIALIFTNLYAREGYVNLILKTLGFAGSERGFLLETGTALPSIMAMDVWMSAGYYMALFLAGMQTIPQTLYDSASLAGANAWQRFFRITLPMLKPTLLFVLVINTIKSFQIFVEVFVMTKGGPLGSTTTLVYYVFVNAFEKTDMIGYASAAAWVLFIILLVLSFIQIKLLNVSSR